jgi:hypothetical protein
LNELCGWVWLRCDRVLIRRLNAWVGPRRHGVR